MRLAALVIVFATWLAASVAQQGEPPFSNAPPAGPPPTTRPAPPPAAPPEGEEPQAAAEPEEVFIPTEELQPDAAVTFPVDI